MSSNGNGMGEIGLSKGSVLYIGSAVPLETAVGIESIQAPCRERYSAAVGPDMKVAGIDAMLTVYSSGISMQYTGDPSNVTWFPMQSFHVSAAVKAVSSGMGQLRFVEIDLPEAEASNHPPIFAFIARRTRGVKVLECHVFIAKSAEAAIALVQSTSYAFEHREGWLSESAPPPGPIGSSMAFGSGGAPVRIVPASNVQVQASNSGLDARLVQSFSINGNNDQPPPAQAPAKPQQQPQQQQAGAALQLVPLQMQSMQNQYFSNWNPYGGQTVMFTPGSPFYPGDAYMQQKKCQHKKKCCCKKCKPKKKKKKKKEKKKKDSDTESEYYYMRTNNGAKGYEVFAPSQPQAVNQYVREYNYYAGEDEIEPQPDYGYDHQLMEYERDVANCEYERMAQDYSAAMDRYNQDLEAQTYGQNAHVYGYDAGYPYPEDQLFPYNYYGGQPGQGYGGLVDDLGYYP